MKKLLLELGCLETTHNYIGDGVYVGMDAYGAVVLAVERETGHHWIVLDPDVLKMLTSYLDRMRT